MSEDNAPFLWLAMLPVSPGKVAERACDSVHAAPLWPNHKRKRVTRLSGVTRTLTQRSHLLTRPASTAPSRTEAAEEAPLNGIDLLTRKAGFLLVGPELPESRRQKEPCHPFLSGSCQRKNLEGVSPPSDTVLFAIRG